MKDLIDEFREFVISRGNVLDMAVGIIVGSAFTSIVNSLVDDIVMPVIGIITGGIDFSSLQIGIGSAMISYGNFLNAVISFLLVALSVFIMLKAVKTLRKKSETIVGVHKEKAEEKTPKPACPFCLEEVKQGASRCPHCGSVIQASELAAESAAELPEGSGAGLPENSGANPSESRPGAKLPESSNEPEGSGE